MIRSILVAGLGDPDNNVVRFCRDNWLEVEWISAPEGGGGKTRAIPDCDAAIIVACYIDHHTQDRIRKQYEGKDIWFYNKGMSDIKEKVLDAVWGENNRRSLENRMVPSYEKFAYVLIALKQRGVKLYERDFGARFSKLISGASKAEVAEFFEELEAKAWLRRKRDKRGAYYEFVDSDIESGIATVIQKRGLFSLVPTSVLMPGASVPTSKTYFEPFPFTQPEFEVVELSEEEWDGLYGLVEDESLFVEEEKDMGSRTLKHIPADAMQPTETIEAGKMAMLISLVETLSEQILLVNEKMDRLSNSIEIMQEMKGRSPAELRRVRAMLDIMFDQNASQGALQ